MSGSTSLAAAVCEANRLSCTTTHGCTGSIWTGLRSSAWHTRAHRRRSSHGSRSCECVRACASRQGGLFQGEYKNYIAEGRTTSFTSSSIVAITNENASFCAGLAKSTVEGVEVQEVYPGGQNYPLRRCST